MNEIHRKIRIIVDVGAVQCPLCRIPISEGFGHRCSQIGASTTGTTFRLQESIKESAQP